MSSPRARRESIFVTNVEQHLMDLTKAIVEKGDPALALLELEGGPQSVCQAIAGQRWSFYLDALL